VPLDKLKNSNVLIEKYEKAILLKEE